MTSRPDDSSPTGNGWKEDPRWEGISRPYSPEDVQKLRGSLLVKYTLANRGARVDVMHWWQLPATGAFHYTPVAIQERFVAPVRMALREEKTRRGRRC